MVKLIQPRQWLNGQVKAEFILGIACTGHGASLSLVCRDGAIRSSVFDRWIGSKHTLVFERAELNDILSCSSPIDCGINSLLSYGYGCFPPSYAFEEIFPEWLDWLLRGTGVRPNQIELAVTSDSHFATTSWRLAPRLDRWLPALRAVALMEHHDIHQRQAFWQSGFERAAVLTLDTCGENLSRLNDRKLCGTIARKQRGQPFETIAESYFPESSAGLLYAVVNHHVGFREGDEGKTMGLAPYGRSILYEELKKYLILNDDGSFHFLSHSDLSYALERYVPAREPGRDTPIDTRHMDVAFAGQALLEQIVCNAFQCALRLTGETRLVYAGGVALNSVANGIALATVKPQAIYISPNPSDTGQSLGCALAGGYELCGWPAPRVELSDYLGPKYSEDQLLQAAKTAGTYCCKPEAADDLIARCLANGHIVAHYNGQAEFGPRALGNRSILCDPRGEHMKDYLNAKVKHREAFRPFAPSVLEEHASDWFCLDARSPYMLRVVAIRQDKRQRVPAIVHVDGSGRVQTVSRSDNPEYWNLIHCFFQRTGIPLVLNTSFNVQGKPIVEKPEHAIECFLGTEIDILYMRPYVLSKKPLSSYLQAQPR